LCGGFLNNIQIIFIASELLLEKYVFVCFCYFLFFYHRVNNKEKEQAE